MIAKRCRALSKGSAEITSGAELLGAPSLLLWTLFAGVRGRDQPASRNGIMARARNPHHR
ncbi:MAG: hypothetical protein LC740_17785, partial [Actinobacteria bacterium]|nr:hypothetical protein [Actinomycetota bacterium]